LRAKAALWSAAVFLVAAIAMMWTVGAVSDRWADRVGEALAKELAQRYADRMNAKFQHEIAMARIIAGSPILREWVGDRDQAPDLRQKALAELSRLGRETGAQKPVATIQIGDRYRRFSTLREEGIDAVVNLADIPKNDFSAWFWNERDLFEREPDRQNLITINAELPQNILKVWVSVPVRNGTLVPAIISTGTEFSAFDLRLADGPAQHEVMLVDALGIVRVHADPARIGRPAGEQFGLKPGAMASLLTGGAHGDHATSLAPMGGALRWFMGAENLGYGDLWLVVAVPDDGTERAEIFLSLGVGLTGCMMVLIVVVHIGLRRLVIDPLASMQRAANRLADGIFSARVPEAREDELGALAGAFNSMAAQLERHTHELEDLVGERTAEVLHERDRADAAFARASEALKQYKQFAALISHEFRNPLAIIKSKSQLVELIAEQGGEPEPDSWDAINRAVNRLQALFDQWLSSEALSAGQFPFTVEPIELGPFLERVLALAPKSDRLKIEMRPVPAALSVGADAALLRAALLNLLDNAVKYSPDGGTIVLCAMEAGGQVALQVIDSGIGIGPEDRERLFERHFRVHPESGPPGLGLGLFMVREVARLHGGEVTVSSILGEGSTFTLLLPGIVISA
jgi:signal transduction histidine kinase